ncbi:hypothetical protein HOP60_09995 [Halomonas daqingensis]|uniref:Uncharacterized protein n=1 Tax=Billgrantia desiderata TaxID=52021 RepID=A0ABS9B518_9GAMM|nr:hypothetical protein [Halomonas desiderata]MCE8042485.1 hypothetical protein [Halomonas desiderata]MCE8047060.1 hypothetical protein [Halomonas desiderata]
MAKPYIKATDPATGERVTLHELSVRHDLYYSTVRRRYWRGQRGWDLVKMSTRWREWNGRELKLLDRHYRIGTPVDEIAKIVGHTPAAVRRRAAERGLKHPRHCSAQAIRNFEAAHGKPLVAIAREYRSRRLSRSDLAGAIGVTYQTLRRFLPDDLWQSWPVMTIGRVDAAKHRRKDSTERSVA